MQMGYIRAHSAFTLFELLFVVSIIGILAGLLLPALAKAKAQGLSAACINNFRQLNFGWQLYIDDNNGRFPYNGVNVPTTTTAGSPNWVGGIFSPQPSNHKDNTNINLLLKVEGSIGPYLKNHAVYRCPSDRSTTRFGSQVHPRVRSVAMNEKMGGQAGDELSFYSTAYYATVEKVTARPPVEGGFLFIDTQEDSIETGCFVLMGSDGWGMFPASRHNGSATISFTDGHIISRRWKDPRTSPPVTYKLPLLFGVTQTGNVDSRWLWQRATVPKKGGEQ